MLHSAEYIVNDDVLFGCCWMFFRAFVFFLFPFCGFRQLFQPSDVIASQVTSVTEADMRFDCWERLTTEILSFACRCLP